MRIPRATFLLSTILLLSFLAVVFAQKSTTRTIPQRLAIEVGLTTPMTLNAAAPGHGLRAFWRIPPKANGESPYSAIKLEPKMAGDKIEVTVTTLSGDLSVVKSCKDWGLLKESQVTSYTLKEGEEVTVAQLSDLGPNFKNGQLSFKAVAATVAPDFGEVGGGGCPCTTCGSNRCCPSEGHCVSCPCGEVCCYPIIE